MPFNDKMNLIELEEALKYWYDKTKKIITMNMLFGRTLMIVMRILQPWSNFVKEFQVRLILFNIIVLMIQVLFKHQMM